MTEARSRDQKLSAIRAACVLFEPSLEMQGDGTLLRFERNRENVYVGSPSEVCLSDVLIAIFQVHGWHRKILIGADGFFVEIRGGEAEAVGEMVFWQLREDVLSRQNDATLTYLADVLSVGDQS